MPKPVTIQQLQNHCPMSKYERDIKQLYELNRAQHIKLRVAKFTAVVVVVLGISGAVAANMSVVSWQHATLSLGVLAILIGAGRSAFDASVNQSLRQRREACRVLNSNERDQVAGYLSDHPELQGVIDSWAVQSEELTVREMRMLLACDPKRCAAQGESV